MPPRGEENRLFAPQPLPGSLYPAHHALTRKMLHKGQQELVELIGPHPRRKPIQRRRHHLRIKLLPVLRDQDVACLVDQTHCEKLGGMYGALGMLLHIANLVHSVSKGTAGRNIAKNYVPRIGKKRLGELVSLTHLPRNVEFHH